MRRSILSVIVGCVLLAAAPLAAQVPSAAQLQNPELDKQTLKPGANSFAEGQARELLQAKGYVDVSPLKNDSAGIWHGTAVKDRKPVEVSVDFQGRIQER